MVIEGLEKNVIKIVDGDLDHGCSGVVCQIGDNQFYYNPYLDDGEVTAESYLKVIDKEILVHEIFTQLDREMRIEFPEEYEYYYFYLDEALGYAYNRN